LIWDWFVKNLSRVDSGTLVVDGGMLSIRRAPIVCRIRARTIARKIVVIQSSRTPFHIEPIYTHIFTCHIYVITMSYLKYSCVLTWYYVFAIKIKYYGRKKVRHIAIPLHYSNGSHICISIIIQYFQKYPFTHILYRIKKRDLKKFFTSSLIACITCVLYVSPLILFSFN